MSHSEESTHEAESKSMVSILTEDLLLEIFLRLPHARNLIQCSTVCKRWFSLLSDPRFILQYSNNNQFHNSPYTIFFCAAWTYTRVYELFSEKSKILHGVGSYYNNKYLNFFPNEAPKSLAIKASVQDLLLVSSSYLEYHICNPLTRQCVPLPEPPNGRYNVCGLSMCEPNNSQLSSNYKVLLKGDISVNEYEYVLDGAIFCSETGKWSRSMLWCPRTLVPEFEWWSHFFVANNGILYSQLTGNKDDIRGFAAVDLSCGAISTDTPIGIQFRFRFLHLPFGFGRGWRASLEHVCSGVVQGRLRLSQLLKTNQKFVLKVWELNHNGNDNLVHWLLVHEVRLKRNFNKTNRMFVAAFHPNNGDVIFVFCDHDLYKYEIGEGKYKKVGQLPDLQYPTNNADKLARFFRTCTLVHPSWPTLIPILPST